MNQVDYDEPFGQFLKRKLAERGLSYRQASEKMGLTSNMVSQWTADEDNLRRRRPNPENVVRLAQLLNVDEDELMIRAGHRQWRDTDPHPVRAELVSLAKRLPLTEAPMAIEFLQWQMERSLRHPYLRRNPGSEQAPAGTDIGNGPDRSL